MTDQQAEKLMDEAKECLSLYQIERLYDHVDGKLYYNASKYNAEMGG